MAVNVLRFLDWAYRNGDPPAERLDCALIPPEAVDVLEAIWKNIKTADRKPQWSAPLGRAPVDGGQLAPEGLPSETGHLTGSCVALVAYGRFSGSNCRI